MHLVKNSHAAVLAGLLLGASLGCATANEAAKPGPAATSPAASAGTAPAASAAAAPAAAAAAAPAPAAAAASAAAASAAPAVAPTAAAAAAATAAAASAGPAAPLDLQAEPLPLPGGPPVGMDYLAFEPANGKIWVPAGNTARVDVVDPHSPKIDEVKGFATEKKGERTMGPSSAAAGAGFVYVGNRATAQVCAIDAKTMKREGCAQLASSPDGLQYIAATKELYVTTPRDKSIAVLDLKDPAKPTAAGKISFDGEPEGYAADDGRGIFYTNLEDRDLTLAVDAKTRKIVSTWRSGCGEKGPRGLALDPARRHLFVACAEKVVKVLDAGRDGQVLDTLAHGGGVDNIDYLPSRHLLYVAEAREALLQIAAVSEAGKLQKFATAKTVKGGRSVFVDADGSAYVPDSPGGRLLVVKLPR